MKGLAKVPELLYQEFGQYCGREMIFERETFMVPQRYKVRKVIKFPDLDLNIYIGLGYDYRKCDYFSVWEGSLRCKHGSREPILTVVVTLPPKSCYLIDKYIVRLIIPDFNRGGLVIRPQSSLFIGDVIQRAAWLTYKGSS